MNKEELKSQVCEYLDAHRDELIRSGEELLHLPELAYREFRTSEFVGRWFTRLGLKERAGLAVTGRREIALFDGEGKLRHFGSAGPIVENVFAADGSFLILTKDRLLRLKLPEAK